jgi:hypothetical protein
MHKVTGHAGGGAGARLLRSFKPIAAFSGYRPDTTLLVVTSRYLLSIGNYAAIACVRHDE